MAEGFIIPGSAGGDYCGVISRAEDINDDGIGDIRIGAPKSKK